MTMHIIGVLGTKGGTGKTTLTAALAVAAAADGRRVSVLDLDPQSSYSDWFARRCQRRRTDDPNPDLLRGAERASDAVEGLKGATAPDVLFIDGAPGALTLTEDAISVCTLVLIPIRASGLDLGASQDAFEACREAKVPMLAIINDVGRQDSKLVDRMRGALAFLKINIAEKAVSHRVSYVNAMTTGAVGTEIDAAARTEINELWTKDVAPYLGARR